MEWYRGTKENPEIKLDVRSDTDEVMEWIKENQIEEIDNEKIFEEVMNGNYNAEINITGEKYDDIYLSVELDNLPVTLISTLYGVII